MIRVLVEISLPARTVGEVAATLAGDAMPADVTGRLEVLEGSLSCGGLPSGGDARWVPCWVTLQGTSPSDGGFAAALTRLRQTLVDASGKGGARLRAVPAAVQWDDSYQRLRDLGDVLSLSPSAP